MQHLGIVLLVGLSVPIVSSAYSLLGAPRPTTLTQQNYRLVFGLIQETTSLLLLCYVMSRQDKTWKDIGWKVGFADIPRGLVLYVIARIATAITWTFVQFVHATLWGHWLEPKPLNSVSFGITFLSVWYVSLAPFFEELIVRGYAMSEIMSAGGSKAVAILASVALQMSYHLYQGVANCIVLAVIFTAYSIYYAQTRRIVPVVVAHRLMDLLFLFRGPL